MLGVELLNPVSFPSQALNHQHSKVVIHDLEASHNVK